MIYFIADEEGARIKIGFTEAIKSRLSKMRTDSPAHLTVLGVIEGCKGIERDIHKRFASLRLRGEWFTDDPAIRGFIAEAGASVPEEIERIPAKDRLSVTGVALALGVDKSYASNVLSGKRGLPPKRAALVWQRRRWKIGVLTHATDADCDAFARVMLREAA